MIALFLRRWKETLLVVLVLFAAYSFRASIREAEARGRAEAMVAVAKAAEAKAVTLADSLERAYRVDTVTLRVVRVRTDSILVHRTDTLIHRDTVRLIVERERQMCDAALSTCEQATAARDSVIAALQEQIKAKPDDSNGSFRTGALVGVGLTALAVWLAGGLAR